MKIPPASSAAAFPVSPSMSTATILAPSAASLRTLASPMPLPAPVMTATRSRRRCMGADHSLCLVRLGVSPASGPPAAPGIRIASSYIRGNEHVLGLGKGVEGVRPQFPAQPGLLEAAERRPVADRGVGVDRQVAGLHRARHPDRPAH